MPTTDKGQNLTALALDSDVLRAELAGRAQWLAKALHPVHTVKRLAQHLRNDTVAERIVKGKATLPDVVKLGMTSGWAVREFLFGDSHDVELKAIARSRDTHEISQQIELSQRNLQTARFALGLGQVERSCGDVSASRDAFRKGALENDEIAPSTFWLGREGE